MACGLNETKRSSGALKHVTSRAGIAVALGFSLLLLAPSAEASLVFNGSFETVDSSHVKSFQVQIGSATDLSGWTVSYLSPDATPYLDCVVFPGTGTSDACGNSQKLWAASDSPVGGNYLAIDGDPNFGISLSQTITGLDVGQTYQVSFYQAAAQFTLATGDTTELWRVSLGSETHDSPTMNNMSEGFINWSSQSLIFTADNTTDVLTFLAVGTPQALPPTLLLDGVSLDSTVPEPVTATITGIGIVGILAMVRLKRRR
jgi:hypothetical protein